MSLGTKVASSVEIEDHFVKDCPLSQPGNAAHNGALHGL